MVSSVPRRLGLPPGGFLSPAALGPAAGAAAAAATATVQHLLAAVDFPLDVPGSFPAGLFGKGNLVAHASDGLAVELLGGAAALDVAGDEEADEEVGEGGEVEDVEPDGKRLARGDDAGLCEVGRLSDGGGLLEAGRGGGGGGGGRSEDELLQRVEGTDGGGDDVVDRGAPGDRGGVFGHDGRAVLALGQDDEGVEDLVELAEVEDPAVVVEALVPHAARLGAAGHAGAGEHGGSRAGRGRVPAPGGVVVVDGVAQAARPVEAAEAIGGGRDAAGAEGADEAPPHDAHHAPEGPGRVDGQEDVVQDDEGEEGARLADAPGLPAARLVVLVEQLCRDGIGGGNGQRNPSVQGRHVEAVGDVEGPQNRSRDMRRRQRCRRVGGGEVEETGIGHGAPDLEASHG
ncbi:hypothetical protein Trco_005810 [Trichoderma cornu-damae]|uniref:Uncharacterized protein n=1 Tax=Trichoderma cornu-damae TaxID=654480 RepID=A0A9P8QQH8_9HYPO|nr:hypothetical protein Trco_005810 [Trichoderma cornu-damae]